MSTCNAFTPQDEVFQCWRDLARERDARGREPDVQAFTFSLSEKWLCSRWGLLDRLVLKQHVLHPASARQAEWERDTLRACGEGLPPPLPYESHAVLFQLVRPFIPRCSCNQGCSVCVTLHHPTGKTSWPLSNSCRLSWRSPQHW